MNSLVASSIIFTFVFAAALVAMAVRRVLPEEHVGSDSKEVVRLATGLIATMAALVLGMLVSSAKTYYDASKNAVAELSSEIVSIDRLLIKYGPETAELRSEFRQLVEAGLDRIWPSQASQKFELRPGDHGEVLADQMELLEPKNDGQAAAKGQARPMIISLRQTQWLMFLKSQQNAVPLPLLIILASWLAAIFFSFGLFAPAHSTAVVTLALGALAVSSAIFIMMEMYTPFSGVLRISPSPIVEALNQMRR